MVVDVAQEQLRLAADARRSWRRERLQEVALRARDATQRQQVTLEAEDGSQRGTVGGLEHIVLDSVDLRADVVQKGEDGVDEAVADSIEEHVGAGAAQLRAPVELLLECLYRRHRLGGDRHQVIVAYEEVHLGEADALVRKLDGTEENDEQLVAVVIQLGTLVAVAEVLDRQRMHMETCGDGGNLGIIRRLAMYPHHAVFRRPDRLEIADLMDVLEGVAVEANTDHSAADATGRAWVRDGPLRPRGSAAARRIHRTHVHDRRSAPRGSSGVADLTAPRGAWADRCPA